MNKKRAGPLRRTLRALLCLAVTAAAFWTGLFTMSRWDDLWSGGDYISSYSVYGPLQRYSHQAEELERLCLKQRWDGALNYADQQRLEQLKKNLSPAATNYRFEIHDQSGTLLYSNLPDGESMDSAAAVQLSENTLTQGGDLRGSDYVIYESDTGRNILMACTGGTEDAFVRCDPAETPGWYNRYGWLSDGEDWLEYHSDRDSRVQTASVTLQEGVRWPFTVEDAFVEDARDYQESQTYLPAIAAAAAVTTLLSAWLLFRFCRGAGWRREQEGLYLDWQDRVPFDLYLGASFLILILLLGAGDSVAWSFNQGSDRPAAYVGLGFFTVLIDALVLALLHTLAVRIKARTLLHNTLIGRLCAWLGRFFRSVAANWHVTRRPVLTFLLYVLITMVTIPTVVLVPVWQGFVLWCLCRWVRQWRAIREGTGRIVGGDPDCRISTDKMFPDLKEHAGQLNDLGSAINTAVDERMKSERFKTELITNVSHDLKTPLTSIINYVDLLKKEDIPNPKAQEYIEVLERKSQRLKKLTEDLVEASKASAGTLSVVRERLGFTQLLDQALGEYEEKFRAAGLTPILTSPDHELCVEADGRHLWRVIDNLLGNCCKYAMPGTRVYLDVKAWDGSVALSVKNISRNPLNIPPDQLMERFVRGDVSRTTEGSGLGLSIARSLTELQGGAFRLDIDGDLFKAVVTFPEYRESLPQPGAE